MANIYWEVELRHFADVSELLWETAQAQRNHDHSLAAELIEEVRRLPGFPRHYDPAHDIINVVPKGVRLTLAPALSGLPQPPRVLHAPPRGAPNVH